MIYPQSIVRKKGNIQLILIIVVALIIIAAVIGLILIGQKNKKKTTEETFTETPITQTQPKHTEVPKVKLVESIKAAKGYKNPRSGMQQLTNLLSKSGLKGLLEFLPKNSLTQAEQKLLAQYNKTSPLTTQEIKLVSRKANTQTWSMSFNGIDNFNLEITYKKDGNTWVIDSATLIQKEVSYQTPESIIQDFLVALQALDFAKALSYVDLTKVPAEKIAALCILLEETSLDFSSEKTIKKILNKENLITYLAYLVSKDKLEEGKFAITLTSQEKIAAKLWKISEINLDSVLERYATLFGDGDIYYTPLIKNPKGGDSLALYFEFNEATLSKRTQKQLDIVIALLKNNPNKHLSISGHADSIASTNYNDQLSKDRSLAVKNYFLQNGIKENEVSYNYFGELQPIRPNEKEDGSDNPAGRRANRRAEIYLNF